MQTNADYVVIDRSTLFEKFVSIGGPQQLKEDFDEWIAENEFNMLTIPEFQKDMVQNSMRWFPEKYKDGIDLTYLLVCIGAEAGEILGELQHHMRGSITFEEFCTNAARESVDLFHFLCLFWVALQVDPGVIYAELTEKNEKRFGKLNGEG